MWFAYFGLMRDRRRVCIWWAHAADSWMQIVEAGAARSAFPRACAFLASSSFSAISSLPSGEPIRAGSPRCGAARPRAPPPAGCCWGRFPRSGGVFKLAARSSAWVHFWSNALSVWSYSRNARRQSRRAGHHTHTPCDFISARPSSASVRVRLLLPETARALARGFVEQQPAAARTVSCRTLRGEEAAHGELSRGRQSEEAEGSREPISRKRRLLFIECAKRKIFKGL